jgi:D-3-phosphoglycerate dehydrogenase
MDAVGVIAGTKTLDADIMENLTNLKVISRCGTGIDNVALFNSTQNSCADK